MSSPSDRVHGTPPTNTSAPPDSARELETGLAIQQREREATLRDLARLRKEASAEIDRLLAFLDASDEYAADEREPDGDELDASYPESGSRLCTPGEDDEEDDFTEDGSDDEPSLGSGATHAESTQGSGLWANPGRGVVDAEDEHDGAEEDHEGDDSPDHEPNLGWTVDGCIGNTAIGRDELELAEPTGTPQDRTTLPATFTVENRYWPSWVRLRYPTKP